ncbi:MAG: hypothetical protein NTY22_03565 [Proteobacteria bacterium]|nr:hypothetical protein [Pseudomonadota bacterium]
MIIIINFLIFSLFIFISDALVTFSTVRLERRIGISSNLLKMIFNITPSYIKKIVPIFIVFMAVQLVYLHITDSKYFIFLTVLIIFLTTVKIGSEPYAHSVTSASCFLSIIICVLTVQSMGTTNRLIINNPFLFVSLVVAIFAISIFNKDKNEAPSMNIARNLALNIYIVSAFIPELSFIYSMVLSVGFFYLQFILHQVYPKLNLFQTMRQSLTILLSASLICFIGSLLWVVFIMGGI